MSDGGQLITFYSYKGGTGRTMALVNVACLMAKEGRRVLAITSVALSAERASAIASASAATLQSEGRSCGGFATPWKSSA
jgi:MinD-like ATPase involved in chromosome partitioning or flagellar assembly